MDYKIGDRVRVKLYENLTGEMKNKGVARIAGKCGEVVDKLWSESNGCVFYKLKLDDYSTPSRANFLEDSIELVPEQEEPTYTYEFEMLENLVVARLYEVTEGGKTEIAKGHGHIFHDGVYGIAQASSYALKRIMQALEDDANG